MGILMGIMGTCSVSASPVENSVSQKDCYAKVSEQEKREIGRKIRKLNKNVKNNSSKSSISNALNEFSNFMMCVFIYTALICKGCELFCERGSERRMGFKKSSDEAFKTACDCATLGLLLKLCS